MNRRGFLTRLATGIIAAGVDPEALLWTPKKTIFIPPPHKLSLWSLETEHYPVLTIELMQKMFKELYKGGHMLAPDSIVISKEQYDVLHRARW